ncbi:WhiB family transcriptional regulator [Salinifilum ghardaiensis]
MTTVPTVPDWRDRAACRHVAEPEAFFPLSPSARSYAQGICSTCPVAAECLAEALTRGVDHGIWGGYTPQQRRSLRRTQEVAQ